MKNQQGDVLLYQSIDNGEIEVVDGVTTLTGGFETAAYLSLFGGNRDDDGSSGNTATWWGNLDETQPSKKYVSETQFIIDSLPATANNLKRVQDAAARDLNWLISENIASQITIVASIPKIKQLKVDITIIANGEESNFEFVENWKASK